MTPKKLVCNIGLNDSRAPIRRREDNWVCPYYKAWERILRKVTTTTKAGRYKHRICHEWTNFTAFKKWAKSQPFEGRVLMVSGNTFSPETAAYFSQKNANNIKHGNLNLVHPESEHERKVLIQIAKKTKSFTSPICKQVRTKEQKIDAAIIRAANKCTPKNGQITQKAILDQLKKSPYNRHITIDILSNRLARMDNSPLHTV